MNTPSNSQVKKAGKVLRGWALGELTDQSAQREALGILEAFRRAHGVPLGKATMGLRSVVRTEQCRVEVSQRLKRTSTIIDKLTREPNMQLSTMYDIGGCRAVLDNLDEVRRVQRRLSRNRPPIRLRDYIDAPRKSGYRGVHLVVAYDDRPIEVQLRTRVMHEWAITVEQLGDRLNMDLKSGRGPQEVLELLAAASELMALEESGSVVDSALVSHLVTLRKQAVPFIEGGRS